MSWLQKSLGLPKSKPKHAILTAPINFKPDLTYFAQVKTEVSDTGELLATPIEGNGSGDLANLVNANAFLEVPRGSNVFAAGTALPFIEFL